MAYDSRGDQCTLHAAGNAGLYEIE
jgi:hypothetical protein